MGERLQELIKYLSESDYQPIGADNIINPQEEKPDLIEVQKQVRTSAEHVTSSGAEDWLNAPDKESRAADFGMKKPGLVPYTSLVRPTGKTPYFATRWRKVDPNAAEKEVNIIPVENFQGDIKQIYDAWKQYVGQQEEADSQDLMLPLLGLQDFIEEGRKGVLAQIGNRVIGLASIEVDEMGEARVSILSAAPKEIEEGEEAYVEDALREGLETYVDEHEWNLITSTDANVEQESLKKAYRSIRISKAKFTDAEKASKAAAAKAKGWFPKTGDWMNPGNWITSKEEAIKEHGADHPMFREGEDIPVQQRGTQEERRRGQKYPEGAMKAEDAWGEGKAREGYSMGGMKIPKGSTDVILNPDPNAKQQAWYRNTKGIPLILRTTKHFKEADTIKYGRGNEFAADEDVILNKVREEVANGREEAQVLLMMALTSMRPGNTRGKMVYGATTILGENIRINGDKVDLQFTGKSSVPVVLPTIENKELAQMLWDKKGQKTKGNLFSVTDHQVRRYFDEWIVGEKGVNLGDKGYKPYDFRTLGARKMTVEAISKMPVPTSKQEYDQAKTSVITAVSRGLGNSPQVAETSYIDPMLFEDWPDYDSLD